jgi:hypothetical protein
MHFAFHNGIYHSTIPSSETRVRFLVPPSYGMPKYLSSQVFLVIPT